MGCGTTTKRPPAAPTVRAQAPPTLYVVSLRPGFSGIAPPKSPDQADIKTWFEGQISGVINAPFYQPAVAHGRTVLTDGYNFATVDGDTVNWTPALRCGLAPEDKPLKLYGRFPALFTPSQLGWMRWTAAEQRFRSVGPTRDTWPSQDPSVAYFNETKLLVLWPPRRRLQPIAQDTSATSGGSSSLPPGLYVLGDDLTPLDFEVSNDFLNQAVIDLQATEDGVVVATSAGIAAWRGGRREPEWFPVALRQPLRNSITRAAWLDVAPKRPIEAVFVTQEQTSGIVRFDKGTWMRVPIPLQGLITAWAPTHDGGRLYAEMTESSGPRIWQRSSTGAWALLAELPDELPKETVVDIARDRRGAVWALAVASDRSKGALWYIAGPGSRTRVTLPLEGFRAMNLIVDEDDVVWVKASDPSLQLALFATRRFRELGVRLAPGDDGCRKE